MAMPKTVTANAPQFAQAFQITLVGPADSKTNQRQLTLASRAHVVISGLQAQQYLPLVGDYYVVPSEGHPYCTPKSTFLQNYTVSS